MDKRKALTDYQGYIFDLDGTVYLGERLLPGAKETVATLRAHNKQVAFLSNKPIQVRSDYARKLTRLGIPTGADDVINSSYVMARYLAAEAPGATVYVIGETPLIQELMEAGLNVLEDPSERYVDVDYVVAAFDRTFDYAKLNHALQAIKLGARFVATNGDRTCPLEDGEIPDAAGMIGAIEGVTGKKVEQIVGKPNQVTVQIALEHLGLQPRDCLVVGDRIETDMLMAVRAHMGTALVLTGVTKATDLPHPDIALDHVLNGVYDIRAAFDNLQSDQAPSAV